MTGALLVLIVFAFGFFCGYLVGHDRGWARARAVIGMFKKEDLLSIDRLEVKLRRQESD